MRILVVGDDPVTTVSSETDCVQLSQGPLGERARLRQFANNLDDKSEEN